MGEVLELTGPQVTTLLSDLDACPEAQGWLIRHQHLDSRELYARAPAAWIVWLGAALGQPEALDAVCEVARLWLVQQPQNDPEVIVALRTLAVMVRYQRSRKAKYDMPSEFAAAASAGASAFVEISKRWEGGHPANGGNAALHLAKSLAKAVYHQGFETAEWANEVVATCFYGVPLDDLVSVNIAHQHLPYEMLATAAAKFQAEQQPTE